MPTHTLAVDEPSALNTVMLPDVEMGTIVTAGALPDYAEKDMVAPDLLHFGDTTFATRAGSTSRPGGGGQDADVAFGSADSRVTVEMNAVLRTRAFEGLVFEGALDDGRSTSIFAETASGHNILTLPDADGTVLVTGAIPDTLPFLTVLEGLEIVHGATVLGGNGGAQITLGADVASSAAWFHHTVVGRFPLEFSGLPPPTLPTSPDGDAWAGDGSEEAESWLSGDHGEDADAGPALRIQVTPSTTRNVITLPDVSGTVVTTGNIGPLLAVPHVPLYRIHARNVNIAAQQMLAMGTHAAQLLLHQSTDNDPVCGKTTSPPYPTYAAPPAGPERAAEGIFAFVDGSHSASTAFGAGQGDKMPRVNANSFYVRAHGGVRFATGIVPRGAAKAPLEMGVQIPAKGSCWSVLSDRNAKTNVSQVDDAWVLNALAKVPVSTWQYAGGPEGGGEDGRGVTHMGPMAQDFNEALWPLLGNTGENETLAEKVEDEGARIHTSDADGALMSAARGMVDEIKGQSQRMDALDREVEKLQAELKANEARIQRNKEILARHRSLLASVVASASTLLA